MHLSRALCATLSVPVLVAGLLAAPPAAAAETSTGVRCTVVGTAGADLLVGTSGRDVICGRGGADVIRAKGGDDLVDAGTGSDVVTLGGGDDRVLAGPGGDEVAGGSGDDRIAGGDGADHLGGGGGEDTVGGGAGPDDLGGGGAQDDLDGNGGDDTLEGGTGPDDLDGGVGDNLCIVDAADESVRCRYDEAPPVLVQTLIEPGTVNVTAGPAPVTIRVHATDDTGVESVQVSLVGADGSTGHVEVPEGLQLESGTAKDGWWTTTFEVPRYTRPAHLRPEVYLRDRLDRSVWDDASSARLVVLDENPDTTPPHLELLAPLGSDPVDVRTAAADVTVSVRGTDDLSGVGRLDLCLSPPPSASGLQIHGICRDATPRTSGTARNGTWTTTLRVPKGSVSGVWNVTARVQDQALSDEGTWWLGPEAYDVWVSRHAGAGARPFPPDGAGSVTVIGADDRTAAWVETVTVTPAEVDTLPADATTHVAVRARDAEGEGVTEVRAVLVSDSARADAPQFDLVDLVRTSGDLVDGLWEGDLLLPQGTPPGTYHVLVGIADIAHATNYVGASYPHDDHGYGRLDQDPVVVVVDRATTG